MKEAVTLLQRRAVSRNNALRFTCASMMEAALKAETDSTKRMIFLIEAMDLDPTVATSVGDRIFNGESFTTVTNELNAQGKL